MISPQLICVCQLQTAEEVLLKKGQTKKVPKGKDPEVGKSSILTPKKTTASKGKLTCKVASNMLKQHQSAVNPQSFVTCAKHL